MEFTTPEIRIPSFNVFIPTWDTSPVAFWIMCGIAYFLMWGLTARIYERWVKPQPSDVPGVVTGFFWPVILPFLLIAKFSER